MASFMGFELVQFRFIFGLFLRCGRSPSAAGRGWVGGKIHPDADAVHRTWLNEDVKPSHPDSFQPEKITALTCGASSDARAVAHTKHYI